MSLSRYRRRRIVVNVIAGGWSEALTIANQHNEQEFFGFVRRWFT